MGSKPVCLGFYRFHIIQKHQATGCRDSVAIHEARVSVYTEPDGFEMYRHCCLVCAFNPSEKYLSVEMIIPNIWEKHVPNHQPVVVIVIAAAVLVVVAAAVAGCDGGHCRASGAAGLLNV